MLLLARVIHTRFGYNGLSISDQYLILINQTALNFKRYRGTGQDSIEFATCRLTALSRPPPARSLSLFALCLSRSVAQYCRMTSQGTAYLECKTYFSIYKTLTMRESLR